MEAELAVKVVYWHIRERAKGSIDAAHNLMHHAAQLLVLWNVSAAGDSNLQVRAAGGQGDTGGLHGAGGQMTH